MREQVINFFRGTAFGINFHQMLPGITACDAVEIPLSDKIYKYVYEMNLRYGKKKRFVI